MCASRCGRWVSRPSTADKTPAGGTRSIRICCAASTSIIRYGMPESFNKVGIGRCVSCCNNRRLHRSLERRIETAYRSSASAIYWRTVGEPSVKPAADIILRI